MDQLLAQLISHLRGIWRRRWIGIGVAWLAAIIGGVIVWGIPDRYEASARVFVDTQSVLRPLLSGLAVQPDIDQQVAIVSRTLVSRPNIERLIRMTDLDLHVKSPGHKEELIEGLTRTIKISSAGRDNLYTIGYRDSDSEQAKRVVQSLLSIFVESSLGSKRKDTDSARRFIEGQIRQYEKRLEEAESRLKEFRLKNLHVLGADGRDYFARMATVGEQLNAARLELRAAEQSRDAFKRELAGEEPVFVPEAPTSRPGGSPVSELDGRIDALKKNLDELLRKYTDKHPDVIGTRRVIEELEQERKTERAKPGSPASRVQGNLVMQQLKIALVEAEANVASLRARVGELDSRYNQLRETARMQPELDAELQQLNRDYEIQKKQYENLVARRESAAISGDMDATGGVADFRVIDPPTVSQKPVAPNRPLLLGLALAAALGAGVFASFVVSQIYPTIQDVPSLAGVGERPVLGAVTRLSTAATEHARRRRHLAFAGALGGLFAAYGAAIVFVTALSRVVQG